MPNWTTNTLHLSGTPEQMAPVLAAVTWPDEANPTGDFSFDKVLPMPQELRDSRSPLKVDPHQEEPVRTEMRPAGVVRSQPVAQTVSISLAEEKRRLDLYGATEWYGWSLLNWGAKWNTHRATIHSVVRGQQDAVHELILTFDIAWDVPRAFLHYLRSTGVHVIGGAIHRSNQEFENLSEDPTEFDKHFVLCSEKVRNEDWSRTRQWIELLDPA